MNRAMRRQAMRSEAGRARMEIEELQKLDRARTLYKNGITQDDLQKAFQEGFVKGQQESGAEIVKCCYCGVALALREGFGFGKDRIFKALKLVDEKILYSLHHSEMCDELLEKTGVDITFEDPMCKVKKVSA